MSAARGLGGKLAEKKPLLATAAVVLIALVAIAVFAVLRADYVVWDRGKIGTPRLINESSIHVVDLPDLAVAMERGDAPIRFAALIFTTPDRPNADDSVNLQISIENGKPGFDWVLLGRRNLEDQRRFRAFAAEQGLDPVLTTANGVSYFRVEDTDVATFTASVMTQMYGWNEADPVGLVYEGFDWQQN